MLAGCFNSLKGSLGASANIAESKKRGVFVEQYYPHGAFLLAGDSLQVPIKEAWIEKHWYYPANVDESVVADGYQLIVISEEKAVIDYPHRFTIGVASDKYFRPAGKSSIMTDFKELPQGDSIEWVVQRKYYFADSQPRDTIGRAVLYTHP